MIERQSKAKKLMDLDYGHSKLCVAVHNDSPINSHAQISNARIATSFPVTTNEFFKQQNISTVELEGAVEISVKLGIADAIVDIVETGSSIKQAGLRIVGEPMSYSNAAILMRPDLAICAAIAKLKARVEGKILASKYVMIEYDAPKAAEDQVCAITPGVKSPTITSLKDSSWIAVKSMIEHKDVHVIMDQLVELGCQGIVTSKILSARI